MVHIIARQKDPLADISNRELNDIMEEKKGTVNAEVLDDQKDDSIDKDLNSWQLKGR